MKYILGFTLLFKKYRGSLKLRVFSDDLLIDELVQEDSIDTISDAAKKKLMKNINGHEHLGIPVMPGAENDAVKMMARHISNSPEKIFLYEIDSRVLGDKIRFEINDKNSNYTNGFMTKSNLICFRQVFLIPKHLFAYEPLRKLYLRDRKRCPQLHDPAHPEYAKQENQNTFNHSIVHDAILWPTVKAVGTEDVDGKVVAPSNDQWYGGQTTVHVPLIKKFGIFLLHSERDFRKGQKKLILSTDFLRCVRVFNLLNT
jgi:hypothetical protein